MDSFRRKLLLSLAAFPAIARALQSTPEAAEGPFYPTTAMRYSDNDNDLVKIQGQIESAGGEVVELVGRVLDSSGKPYSGAKVEIWQCDVTGRYLHRGDSSSLSRDSGFQGFGADITDAEGNYRFRTIKPVPYTGRTPHLHVKVWIDGGEQLTTQFYLADHPDNRRDWLFRKTPKALRKNISMQFQATESVPRATVDIIVWR